MERYSLTRDLDQRSPGIKSKYLYPSLAGATILALAAGFSYERWQNNQRERELVRTAPIIEVYGNRPVWAICKKETKNEGQLHICIEQFKKDNGRDSLERIRPDRRFKFRDINRDGEIGRPSLDKFI